MNQSRTARWIQYAGILLLLACTIVIKTATFYPGWIERTYVQHFYLPLGVGMRTVLGPLPFSFGDVIYGVVACWLAYNLYRTGRVIARRRLAATTIRRVLLKAVTIILLVYVVFNLAWGLNYNRLGIAHQLGLQPQRYNRADLLQLTATLVQKANVTRKPFADSILKLPPCDTVFKKSAEAYSLAMQRFPFLQYHPQSVKKSFFGRLGNYLGFLGYYNPFTGEAQVNVTIPQFTIPYVACHEIGHQLGYASESEANFVGYLAAVNSGLSIYRYSVYIDLFIYANRELAHVDTAAARANLANLSPRVRGDLDQLRAYRESTKSPFETFIKVFYDFYLKANQQEHGVESYNEVVGWLIAYQKKYGAI